MVLIQTWASCFTSIYTQKVVDKRLWWISLQVACSIYVIFSTLCHEISDGFALCIQQELQKW